MGFVFEVLIIIALIWYFKVYRKQKGNNDDKTTVAPIAVNTDDLINETISTINDFLDIADLAVHLSSSTDYEGQIFFIVKQQPPYQGSYGVDVCMRPLCDLTAGARKYPKLLDENHPKWSDSYREFIKKYQYCYDSSSESYVYKTTHTVRLESGQVVQLESKLRQQIKERCPLAVFVSEEMNMMRHQACVD